MKLHGNNEVPLGKNYTLHKIFALAFTLVILTIIPLIYNLVNYSFLLKNSPKSPSNSFSNHQHEIEVLSNYQSQEEDEDINEECDIFRGEWIPNPKAPYYTNLSCWAIHEHQNCMKYGRPDEGFLKWRWKPNGCVLPIFNPYQFLELMRDKSLAFVGDSVGRNQMQSLICLLSRVEYPIDVSNTTDENFKRWKYETYNFTIASFWTPHLVRAAARDADGPTKTGLFNLYLDEYDQQWTTQIDDFHYIILSAGHWFFRSMVFYERRRIVGCHYCLLDNVTDLGLYYGYRKAFRTAFKAINGLKNFKGITMLRTFAPSHFENGLWNEGGNCLRTKPFRSEEMQLEGQNLEMFTIQMDEFRVAEREGRRRGRKFRVLDTTMAMLLRPDGHPNRYGHLASENVTLYYDCVHWCLPGPIDAWSDFLLEMLKMEGIRSARDRLQFG